VNGERDGTTTYTDPIPSVDNLQLEPSKQLNRACLCPSLKDLDLLLLPSCSALFCSTLLDIASLRREICCVRKTSVLLSLVLLLSWYVHAGTQGTRRVISTTNHIESHSRQPEKSMKRNKYINPNRAATARPFLFFDAPTNHDKYRSPQSNHPPHHLSNQNQYNTTTTPTSIVNLSLEPQNRPQPRLPFFSPLSKVFLRLETRRRY